MNECCYQERENIYVQIQGDTFSIPQKKKGIALNSNLYKCFILSAILLAFHFIFFLFVCFEQEETTLWRKTITLAVPFLDFYRNYQENKF